MPIRILIADDHGIVRAGLRSLLNAEPDFEVVGEAEDGAQALQLAAQLHPDLVLLDIHMPNHDGIETLPHMKQRFPDLHVLMLTVHEDEGLLRKAIRAGASGYVIKRAAESELISAVRTVCRGDIYIHPAMTRALLRDLVPTQPARPAEQNTLTHREAEVLRLIARGYTNNQIAELLKISPRTVEGHRANLMDKLDLHSRVELMEYAEQHGLLD
jgi:two-component system, NarL family, response regulator NreC